MNRNKVVHWSATVATLLFAATSFAQRASHVTSNTVNNGNGTFTYNFEVFNDSPAPCPNINSRLSAAAAAPCSPLFHRIDEWSLPYFADSGITNVRSPFTNQLGGNDATWAYAIETVGVANAATGYNGDAPTWLDPADPFYFGATSPFSSVTQILRWYVLDACGDGCVQYIDPNGSESFGNGFSVIPSLAGFGFDSIYGATAAPYDAGWFEEPLRSGDPDFPAAGIPNSPTVSSGPNNPAPLPGLMFLFGLGLVVLRRFR
jgi:hypothetical protein